MATLYEQMKKEQHIKKHKNKKNIILFLIVCFRGIKNLTLMCLILNF